MEYVNMKTKIGIYGIAHIPRDKYYSFLFQFPTKSTTRGL